MNLATRTAAAAVAVALTVPLSGCGALALLPGTSGDGTQPAAAPSVTVEGTDGGSLDATAARAAADMYTLLEGKLPNGATLPELRFISYDSANPKGRKLCGDEVDDSMENAFFCKVEPLIAWDRGVLLPSLHETGGDVGVAVVIAHEIGHAANQAQAPDAKVPTLVSEQRADCIAGSYIRWRSDAEEGLDAAAAADTLLSVADTLDLSAADMTHGVGTERMFAFLAGWNDGAASCFAISAPDTAERRDRVRVAADARDAAAGSLDMEWTQRSLGSVVASINTVLGIPRTAPSPRTDTCTTADRPAAVCTDGTAQVDIPGLNALHRRMASLTENATGDGTGLVTIANVKANTWLRDRGVNVSGNAAGLRAACVSGAVLQAMSTDDPRLPILLSAGDLDEAMVEVLVNGLGAADIDGNLPTDPMARTDAFLHGVYGAVGPGACVTAFPDA